MATIRHLVYLSHLVIQVHIEAFNTGTPFFVLFHKQCPHQSDSGITIGKNMESNFLY